MFAGMTRHEGYRHFSGKLKTLYEPAEADAITALVFEGIAGISKKDIIRDGTESMPEEIFQQLQKAFERISKHEPAQYVTGKAWFCHLEFLVNPSVLIPRPETEELVEYFLALKPPEEAAVLDIGTGSGCIAISILKKSPRLRVTALDKSAEALKTAAINAEKHGVSVDFRLTDFLDESSWNDLGSYHFILSNPPYIPVSEKEDLDPHVKNHEPEAALFPAGDDPLIFYRKIAAFAKGHLHEKGKILVEIHAPLATETLKIFTMEGFEAEMKKDMYGKERFLLVSQNP